MMYQLQKVGRSLMIPIAVLPAASVLLLIGNMHFQSPLLVRLAQIFAAGGSAVFDNLPLIFAVGLAIGLTSGEGIAALAATVGYLVFDNVLKYFPAGTQNAERVDMGVLGGMLVGVLAAVFFRRFQHVQLPKALGFFGGKRFVPLLTALVMVLLGGIMGFAWPPVQSVISEVGLWVVDNGSVGVFIYGVMNRLLIPTGLHHIINNIAWFQIGDFVTPTGKVVHGDIARFFAGDPTAGLFTTGFYPVFMFGLPAAALAMIQRMDASRRQLYVPVLLSAGLISFLTGITEPIEFAFMFVAPLLYVVHACLTGLSLTVMNLLGVKVGFGFSAGFIDLALNWNLSTHPLLVPVVGAVYFVVYYTAFRTYLHFFPARLFAQSEAAEEAGAEAEPAAGQAESRTGHILRHIGGAANVVSVDACITRLRLLVKEEKLVDDSELKQLGAIGVIRLGQGNVHIVFGTESEQIREDLQPLLPAARIRPGSGQG
ncbi:PTS transporter subunit EIIC [Paenibacillus athensensis]|uniref:PTS sugar transporter n=1 Tax=Paenibacillus athensensis TaxID=1967502 RepID=A0A4Y8Q9S9_9BACL|nr:PTS transporter subunit EIIC [Paenibacillus athensensis]